MSFPGVRSVRVLHQTAQRVRDNLGKGQEVLRAARQQILFVDNSAQRAIVFVPDVDIKLVQVKMIGEGVSLLGGTVELIAPAAYDTAAGATNRLVAAVVPTDADGLVVSVNMQNGAYTLASNGPGDGVPHLVTITHTTVVTEDTLGTITITGLDQYGNVISEVITVLTAVATSTKAFKSVTSAVGAGWVIAGSNDTVTIGWGDAPVDDLVTEVPLLGLNNNIVAAGQPVIAILSVGSGGAGVLEVQLSYILSDNERSY